MVLGCRAMEAVLVLSLSILLMPSAYAVPLPGDAGNGKRLFDANCTGCHDTGVLTRKDRFVQSLDALKELNAGNSNVVKLRRAGGFDL
jgi:mono/diheme cytochrome c family protein